MPYIYRGLEKMYFGGVMECRDPAPAAWRVSFRRRRAFEARVDMRDFFEGDPRFLVDRYNTTTDPGWCDVLRL